MHILGSLLKKSEVYAIILKGFWEGDEREMQLNEALKMTRQKAFMSQEAFATEISVSVSTINRWENGKAKPNLSAMKEIKVFCEQHNLDYSIIESCWFSY